MTRSRTSLFVVLGLAALLLGWLAWPDRERTDQAVSNASLAARSPKGSGLEGDDVLQVARDGRRESVTEPVEHAPAPRPPAPETKAQAGDACCITGRVEITDGSPVGDAQVWLVEQDAAAPFELPFGAEPLVRSTRTDAEGSFRIPVHPEQTFTLWADAGTYAPCVVASARAGERYVITLGTGAELVLSVQNAQGEPVTAGTVDARMGRSRTRHDLAMGRASFGWERRVALDGAATVRLSSVPVGRTRLVVDCPGFVTETIDVDVPREGTVERTVRLERAARVHGEVVRAADGSPIPGARVGCDATGWASSDAEGRFTLAKVAPGPATWGIEASADGYRPAFEYVQLAAAGDERRVRFELHSGVTLHGRAVDLAGSPVEGAHVRLFGTVAAAAFVGETHRLDARTAVDGRFVMSSVHPDVAYAASVTSPSHGRATRTLGPWAREVEDAGPIDIGDVVLAPPGAIAGRIEGGPDGPARVVLESTGSSGLRLGVRRVEGQGPRARFRFDGLGPGSYRLSAAPSEGEPFATRIVELLAGEVRADVVLGGGASLEGVVLTEAGRPVRSAFVSIVEADRVHAEAHVDDAGRFRLQLDGNGPFRLIVEDLALSYETVVLEEVVPAPDPLEIRTWPFLSPHSIRGRVVLSDGTAAEGVFVGFTDTETGRRLSRVGIVEAGGSFEMRNLRDRAYDVDLVDFDGRYQPVLMRGVLPSGDELRIEVEPK